jgi:hypothetical protein
MGAWRDAWLAAWARQQQWFWDTLVLVSPFLAALLLFGLVCLAIDFLRWRAEKRRPVGTP